MGVLVMLGVFKVLERFRYFKGLGLIVRRVG